MIFCIGICLRLLARALVNESLPLGHNCLFGFRCLRVLPCMLIILIWFSHAPYRRPQQFGVVGAPFAAVNEGAHVHDASAPLA